MINIGEAAIASIKAYLAGKNNTIVLRVQVRTSGCCEPSLALISDRLRLDDLVAETNGLTFVMDPDTHRMAGDVTVELDAPGDCPSFRLIPARPLSEWSGFYETTISSD